MTHGPVSRFVDNRSTLAAYSLCHGAFRSDLEIGHPGDEQLHGKFGDQNKYWVSSRTLYKSTGLAVRQDIHLVSLPAEKKLVPTTMRCEVHEDRPDQSSHRDPIKALVSHWYGLYRLHTQEGRI